MPSIAEAVAEGTRILRDQRAARLLLRHVLELDEARLVARWTDSVDRAGYESYLSLVKRRENGEPVQHITGRQEFYGIDFVVTSSVLIPRPETEFIVDQVISLAPSYESSDALLVDVGTGSGCIAVAMALHLKHLRIIASDLSPEALQLARVNAERHGVAERIEFLEGDLLSPLLDLGLAGRVDIIASNPPYVPAAEIALLQREVRDFEPAVALNGGEDGLDFYRRLLLDCPEFLKPGGCLVFEIGFSQLDAIRRLIDPERWSLEKVTGDLQGIPRTVTLRNRGRR